MRSVTAYATAGPGGPFDKTTIERRDLGPRDVLVAIAYAGICHSDIHTARGEWGEARYPLVPGHEIAGTVEAIGPDVTTFEVGDRVIHVQHSYPHYDIDFRVYRCQLLGGEITHKRVHDHRWVSPQEMDKYEFPAADEKTVAQLLDLTH